MMTAAASLIPELENVLKHGSREKRAETLRHITTLYLAGADGFDATQVDFFDHVFTLLIELIEVKTRAELAGRLAPVDKAPIRTIRRLAADDEIGIAGPVLKHAPRLSERDLIELARTKSQAHLHAISMRKSLDEAVTDVLVRRGDRDVARSVAANPGARFSRSSFSRLVERADSDGILAEKVGLRADIPTPLFQELVTRATAVVRKRLMVSASPSVRAQIRRVLDEVSREVVRRVGPRDYRAAQRAVLALHRVGELDEAALAAFAATGRYEETVVALATLVKVPLEIIDRLMANERSDPVLILCKAIELNWSTVKSILGLLPDGSVSARAGLDTAFANYGQLAPDTAQRVVRYWRLRPRPAAMPSASAKD
jgi:uncharacterized protein (DUF2336 family)